MVEDLAAEYDQMFSVAGLTLPGPVLLAYNSQADVDANEVMPPKSSCFEPKLADGLMSHVLD